MSKSKVFIALSISFMVGVLLGSLTYIEPLWLYSAAGFFVLLFALGKKFVGIFAACLLFTVVGAWRIQQVRSAPSEFTEQFNTKLDVEGVIVADIDERTDKQLLTVRLDGFSQNILVTTTKGAHYVYGDRVWLRGKLVEPQGFDDFDYRGYLERFNVYALMRYPKISVLASNQANVITYGLLKVKTWATKRISNRLAEPQSSLLLGILIGARKTLPQEVIDTFTATGTSHIIAVSGFNISIIVGALGGFLARLVGRRISFWLSLLATISFVIMAGASSSVVRAAVMGVLVLISYNIGRLYSITPSLCLAAVIMLIINPRILFWDAGFQLSFAATVGIVYGVPVLDRFTQNIPRLGGAKNLFLVTLCASLATLPFILFTFGRMSVVALLVNMLVVPIVSTVMLLGAGILLPVVGVGMAFITSYLLQYILFVIAWFARLPFASVSLSISLVTFLAFIIALLCIYALLYWSVSKKKRLIFEDIIVRD